MTTQHGSPENGAQDVHQMTRLKALESLEALLGDEATANELWGQCCEQAACPIEPTSFDELAKIAEHLADLGGPAGLVGNSLSIRIHTYRLLERTQLLEAFLAEKHQG